MLFKRAALALFATCALSSLASLVNSLTIQVAVQDSSLALGSNESCGHDVSAADLQPEDPEVRLDKGTFIGTAKGKTTFLEFLLHTLRKPPSPLTLRHAFIMTFARTGDRRLRRAEPFPPYDEYDYTVQEFGKSCPQQVFSLPISFIGSDKVVKHFDRLYGDFMRDAEDCKAHPMSPDLCITQIYLRGLTVNVVKLACYVQIQLTRSSCKWLYIPEFLWHLDNKFFSGSLAVHWKSAVLLRVYPPSLVHSLSAIVFGQFRQRKGGGTFT